MTSKALWLIPQRSGFLTSKRYLAATIFVDHATSYGYVYLQEDRTLSSTLAAKAAYERHAHSFGITIKRYHADNGRFADQSFQEEITKHDQQIDFCGVGTHHQNGIAERRIRSLTELPRTYLAHAMHRWPPTITSKCVSPILWPFAVKYANEIMNTFRFDKEGLSPLMKFASTKTTKPYLHDLHTFGCPAFVLDGPLQSGQKTPRWQDRTITDIFLGRSPQHAGNVCLILNHRTGHISPQFHVVFDDDFTTVEALAADSEPDNWTFLCKAQSELDAAHEVDNSGVWHLDPAASTSFDLNINEMASSTPIPSTSASEGVSASSSSASKGESTLSSSASEGASTSNASSTQSSEGTPTSSTADPSSSSFVDLHTAGHRRSSRLRANKTRLTAALISLLFLPVVAISCLAHTAPVSFIARHFHHDEFINMNADGTINSLNPMSFIASAADNEVYHFGDMLKQPDMPDFLKAMVIEVKDHTGRGHWVLRPLSAIGDQ